MASKAKFFRAVSQLRGLRWRSIVVGGGCFWLPAVAYRCIAQSDPPRLLMLLLTFAMPLAAILAYVAIRVLARNQKQSVSLSMALGIWVLGPTMIILGQTCLGGCCTSRSLIETLGTILLATLVPIYTMIMASYDLSIVALLLATAVLIVLHRKYEKGKPILAPENGQAKTQHGTSDPPETDSGHGDT